MTQLEFNLEIRNAILAQGTDVDDKVRAIIDRCNIFFDPKKVDVDKELIELIKTQSKTIQLLIEKQK